MCCNWPCFYKARIAILAFLSLCEAICIFLRIFIFISPAISTKEPFSLNNVANVTDRIAIAFILDWTSSLMATLMGMMLIIFVVFSTCFCCLACVYASCRAGSTKAARGCCDSLGSFKALHRFISLDCNCPCYRARPKLRFRLRVIFLFLCLAMRGVAIYLYWTVSVTDSRAKSNFYSCLISLVFIFATFLLDLYHYGVWWCYTPQMDRRCHCRSRKHKRYLPYHIVGSTNRKGMIGDRQCTSMDCRNWHLSHVLVFHSSEYKPQPRWSKLKAADPHATYIGFHTTTPEAAVSIVHSEFRLSEGGMLGKGVYFARSREDTIGKAQNDGACIIAEIRMGRVFEFDKQTIYPTLKKNPRDRGQFDFVRDSRWHDEYDTCYMNHEVDNKDEFCIKDPAKQIIKWIVMIDEQHDGKVQQYGLDSEFDSTKCYCV